MIYIFTDGACSGNPGPGGWGTVIKMSDMKQELSGSEKNSTNNRMELTAVIEGLNFINSKKKEDEITIITDSQYVKNGITLWIKNWLKNNWKTAAKKPVKNQDLWKQLYALTQNKNITWEWVKGHSGHPENERCDALATTAITRIK